MRKTLKNIYLVPLVLILASVALRPVAVVAHNSLTQTDGPAFACAPGTPAAHAEKQQILRRVASWPTQFRTLEKQVSNEESLIVRAFKIEMMPAPKARTVPVRVAQKTFLPRLQVLRI